MTAETLTAEKVIAAVLLAACVLLLLRMPLGDARRERIDASLGRFGHGLRALARRLWRWPSHRKTAARTAEEAIRRARQRSGTDGEWDGNVYKPKSFRRPEKRD